jgi:phosphoserine phosphatase
MTKLILTRHGHVEGIKPERFRGRIELPLTEIGVKQAEATARRIALVSKPVAIYTSPMGRSIATAKAIGAATQMRVKIDERLNDIDYGAWQGLTRNEAASKWSEEIAAWYRTPQLASPPGGETLQVVSARVIAAIHEILRRHPHGLVVVVGHDSINKVILLHALDLPLSHYWNIKQDPCAVNELDFVDGAFSVATINETWHLQSIHQGARRS